MIILKCFKACVTDMKSNDLQKMSIGRKAGFFATL